MTIIPVVTINIELETITASQSLTNADEQTQLAIAEALWRDRCDYYQSSQFA